jgi:hypothetical protein
MAKSGIGVSTAPSTDGDTLTDAIAGANEPAAESGEDREDKKRFRQWCPRAISTLALLGIQEMALNVLTTAGFDLRTAGVSVVAIFDYTLGAAFEEQAEPAPTTLSHSTILRSRHSSLDSTRLPLLAAAFDDITAAAANDPHVGFKGGIHLLLAGMVATKKATSI